MRKLAAAAAALALFAGSLAWAQPAAAAPSTPCSVEEWQNPGNWSDCVQRTREALDAKTGCVAAPAPGSPSSGLAGMFSTEPDSAKRDGVPGLYSLYGVGGYGLDTYDLGCLDEAKHPELKLWNAVASGEFRIAAGILGAANGLREMAYNPGSMWSWSDGFVESATGAIYRYVFQPFGVITLIVAGLFLLWISRAGKMPQVMRVVLWALFAMTLTTAVMKWPTASVHHLDGSATAALNTMHSVLGPGPQHVPAGQCPLGGDACTDHRSVSTRASDVATETILYRNWIRAVLGDADSPVAQKYGPALYDATTFSWAESSRDSDSVQVRQNLIEQKADRWNTLARQIRAEDALAYEHMQGVHGSDRVGAGFFAMVSAGVFSLFDVAASLVILFGYGLFRIAVVFLPLVMTVGLFEPASGPARRVLNMVIASMINIAMFGAVAGGYLFAAVTVFGSDVPAAWQIVIVALLGLAGLLITRPFAALVTTITGRSRAKEGLTSRLLRHGKDLAAEKGLTIGIGPGPMQEMDGPPPRPETATQPSRSYHSRAADILAPGAVEAAQHPIVVAGVQAARTRPDGAGLAGTARTVAVAAGGAAAAAATAAVTRPDKPADTSVRPETVAARPGETATSRS